MEYDRSARLRLGREVRAARVAAGYRKRDAFASEIKRSARQVQALENGESGVGPDTWAAAAEGLGWPLTRVYELLDATDGADKDVPPSPLASVSDEELVDEIRRRMARGGGAHAGSAAPTTEPGSGRALRAARNVSELPRNRVAADAQDADATGSQDPDDWPTT